MTAALVWLGKWCVLSFVFGAAWGLVGWLQQRKRERLAAEFVAACRQRYERDLAAAGLREVTDEEIAAAFVDDDLKRWAARDAIKVDEDSALWSEIRVASVKADGKSAQAAWGLA